MALPGGYWGRYLRVNLSNRSIRKESMDDAAMLQDHIGGTGIGAKILYEEVPDGTPWDGEQNRVSIFSGPLAGGPVGGAGLFSAVFKGPMTNSAGSSQANGFLGSFLKLQGYDGMVIEGKADFWSVLVITDGEARLINGEKYLGLDTYDTQDIITADLGLKQASVFSIGPAGEKQARFAVLAGDKGHICSKNGLGAVLGAKKLKAIVVSRGNLKPSFFDEDKLSELARALMKNAREANNGLRANYGTAGQLPTTYKSGQLPIKNYTTNIWEPFYEKFTGQYLRKTFKHKPKPCWACSLHSVWMTVTDGPYADLETEEPEYEALAAFGSQIGNTDPGGAIMLNDLNDRLGLDCNEMGWVLGWAMECVEKGILTSDDLDGIDLRWGNVEAAARVMRNIANREGFGSILAEGVMRASQIVGRGSETFAVGTLKGNTPRGHDHRGRWGELVDTTLSNTGTLEAVAGPAVNMQNFGLPPVKDRFSPEEVSTANGLVNGGMLFYDLACICRFTADDFPGLIQVVNAATGWDMTVQDALTVGRRTVNRLRVFNLKHGLNPETELPSSRYGSAPVDGPVAGLAINPVFKDMRANYWRNMGWSETEGRPLPETLSSLRLNSLIKDAWPDGSK